MRKKLFLALALLMTLGAVTASPPPAEAGVCRWVCGCYGLECSCVGGGGSCGAPIDLDCPPCS